MGIMAHICFPKEAGMAGAQGVTEPLSESSGVAEARDVARELRSKLDVQVVENDVGEPAQFPNMSS